MRSDKYVAILDSRTVCLGVFTPKHKDCSTFSIHFSDHFIGQLLPSNANMTTRLTSFNRETRVK